MTPERIFVSFALVGITSLGIGLGALISSGSQILGAIMVLFFVILGGIAQYFVWSE
jgi:hypothetical protein